MCQNLLQVIRARMCGFCKFCRKEHEGHLLKTWALHQQYRHWDSKELWCMGKGERISGYVLGRAPRHQTHHAVGLVCQDVVLLGNQHGHALGFKCQQCAGQLFNQHGCNALAGFV